MKIIAMMPYWQYETCAIIALKIQCFNRCGFMGVVARPIGDSAVRQTSRKTIE